MNSTLSFDFIRFMNAATGLETVGNCRCAVRGPVPSYCCIPRLRPQLSMAFMSKHALRHIKFRFQALKYVRKTQELRHWPEMSLGMEWSCLQMSTLSNLSYFLLYWNHDAGMLGGCLGRALSISRHDKSTPLRCSQDLLIPSYSRSLVLSFLLIWPILCARRSPRKRPGSIAQESDHSPPASTAGSCVPSHGWWNVVRSLSLQVKTKEIPPEIPD